MATVLMVESWLHSTGLTLPGLIRSAGHDYVLLARDPGVYRLDGGRPHPVIVHADEVVVAETNDTAAAIRAARDLSRRRRVDGVLTTCDYYLALVARIAADLDLPGADPDALLDATRKHRVRRALLRAGIPDVRYAVAGDGPDARKAAASLGYPLVVKPVDANSGTSVRLVHDESGLHEAFGQITGPTHNTRGQPLERLILLEEVLDGPEVSVETVTRDGRTTVLAITAKSVLGPDRDDGVPGFIEAGHLVPARLSVADRGAVEALARSVVVALGIGHGLAHIEVRLTSAGPRVVEVNPRQGGGYIFDLVRLTTGRDPLRGLIDLALGDDQAPVRPSATSAAVAFVMSLVDGTLAGVRRTDALVGDRRIVRCELPQPGLVRRPADNNTRIGHVLAADPDGAGAESLAREVVAGLRLDIDGRIHSPLVP